MGSNPTSGTIFILPTDSHIPKEPMPHPYAHLPTEFIGFWNSLEMPEEKIAYFLEKFGAVDATTTYHPLLVNNYTCTGELAHSFGLFVKDGALFEVTGSECSVWNFNGQWEPEETSTAALLRRLDKGSLGQEGDDDTQFAEPLRTILEWIDSAIEKQVLLNNLPHSAPTIGATKKI